MFRWLVLWTLLVLSGSVGAQDDQAQIIKAYGGPVDEVTLERDWALIQWSERDAAGQALFHRMDGRWVSVFGGGGALDAAALFKYGVPRSSWGPLLKRSLSSSELRQVSPGPYWIDRIRCFDLQNGDFYNRSDWELTLMRNEIFAVHGRPFQDQELRAYFGQRAWYRPDPAYRDERLTPRELRNARKIANWQAVRR